MASVNKVYCADCEHWRIGVDQCDIPSTELRWKVPRYADKYKNTHEDFLKFLRAQSKNEPDVDPKVVEFLVSRMSFINFAGSQREWLHGVPSELNYDNTCVFYKPMFIPKLKSIIKNFINLFDRR